MKKNLPLILFIIVLTTVLSAVFFTHSGMSMLVKLPYFRDIYNNTSLTINLRKGVADITVNNKEYGETPLTIEDLTEGRYEVVLDRKTKEDIGDFYQPEHIYIDLYRSTEAIIDIEIAPGGYKSGYVLYYTPAPQADDKTGFITVKSNSQSSNLFLDSDLYKELPVSVDELKTGEYQLKIEAAGYESIEVPVIIRQGYNLNINTYLLPIPINLDSAENNDN